MDHFDPMELWGTRIPFVDPFNQEEHTFCAPAAPPASMKGASLSNINFKIESEDRHPRFLAGPVFFPHHFDPMELWGTQVPFVDPFYFDDRTICAPAAPPAPINVASLSSVRGSLEDARFHALPSLQAARLETHLLVRGENQEEGWTRRRDESGGGQTGKNDEPEKRCIHEGTDIDLRYCRRCLELQDLLPPQRIVQLVARDIDTCLEPLRRPGRLPKPRLEVVLRMDRVKLRPDQAIYIFQQRSTKTSRTAALLSAKFGITPKAIRDIWRQRSWGDETRDLES